MLLLCLKSAETEELQFIAIVQSAEKGSITKMVEGDKATLKGPIFTVIKNVQRYVSLSCCRCGKNIAKDELIGICNFFREETKFACLDCLEENK